MSAVMFLEHFERLSEAPESVPRFRSFIFDLAVRGKLVEQDPRDEPASELLTRFQARKISPMRAGNRPITAPHDRADNYWKLPATWERRRFGSLLDLQYGKALPAPSRTSGGDVPVYGSNGVVGKHSEALTASSAIVVGRKGSAGALNIADGPSWTTDVAYFLIPPPCYRLRFLFIVLSTLRLDSLRRGIKPGLNRSEAYELPIVIAPLAEQDRTVAKVDELMKLCDRFEVSRIERERRRDYLVAASLNRLNQASVEMPAFRDHARFQLNHLQRVATKQRHVEQVREMILNLAVSGKLLAQDARDEPAGDLLSQIRAENPRRANDVLVRRDTGASTELRPFKSHLPLNWQTASLGDLCKLVTSGSRGWAEFYSKTGAKFVRAQNIRFGKLKLDDLACVNPPKTTEGSRTKLSTGDLLIVITGAGVTNPALLDQELGDAYVSQHVALVRPTTTRISRWLLTCLMAPAGGRSVLVERAYGAGKPGLNLDNIRSLEIPIPPLAEQHRIIAKVDELMAICAQLETQLTTAETKTRRLLDAVLHQAIRSFATVS